MFSSFSIRKLSLWLLIIAVCSFTMAGLIAFSNGVDNVIFVHPEKGNGQEVNVEKSFDFSNIKDINVSTVSTDINIIPVEAKDIRVHFHGKVSGTNVSIPELIANVSGSKLDIQIKHNKEKFPITLFNIGNSNLKLDVYMPREYSSNMKLNTVSGEANIEGFNIDNFYFTSVSGNLKAKSVNTSSSDIHSTSGNIKADNFSGGLNCNTISGQIDIVYSSFNNNIKIDSVSGNAKIKLPSDASFRLQFNSVSGDINCKLPIIAEGGKKPGRNDFTGTVGNGKNNINIHTTSGDAEIYD